MITDVIPPISFPHHEMIQYAIVTVISIVFTFFVLATECANGNIIHVKNGREPNAGATIFPGIPFFPILAIVVMRIGNSFYPKMGFWLIVIGFVLYIPYWIWELRKLNAQLESMLAERNASAAGVDVEDPADS